MDETIREAQERLEERRKDLGTSQPTRDIGEKTRESLTTEDREKIKGFVCERHDYMNPRYERMSITNSIIVLHCPDCNKEREEERRRSEESVENEFKRRKIEENMSSLQIGKRFRGMTIEDYKPVNQDAEEVKETCRRYIDTFKDRMDSGDGLILIGSCGTGKNMLAAIICQAVVNQAYSAVHTTIFKLVRKVKDSWRDKEESEGQVMRSFSEPDLLVIDEVGVQFGSDTEKLYLTEVINDRYENRKPTILISNLNLQELEDTLGQRVVDRFYEGKSAVLRFTWDSYRRSAG